MRRQHNFEKGVGLSIGILFSAKPYISYGF